jgi:hypothetical protein
MGPEVQQKIYGVLLDIDRESADFFQLTNQTGLRGGEALGLSMKDVLDVQPGGDLLCMLKQYGLNSYGCILLIHRCRIPCS